MCCKNIVNNYDVNLNYWQIEFVKNVVTIVNAVTGFNSDQN